MKKVIEDFTTTTGWTSDGTLSVHAQNTIRDFIADHLASSLVIKVPAGSLGKYITKTVAVNVVGYDEMVMSTWSRNLRSSAFREAADFSYKVELASGSEWYLPTHRSFSDVTFGLEGLTATTKVKITALHNEEDYLVLSGMYAIKDEYPADVFEGVRAELVLAAAARMGKGWLAGTFTGAAGALGGVVSGAKSYLARHAIVLIENATGTAHPEYHRVKDFDNVNVTFDESTNPECSGKALLYDRTAANVYVFPAVTYGTDQKEVTVPSIELWQMAPEPIMRSSDVEAEPETFKVNGHAMGRRVPLALQYSLLINCTARHGVILAELSRIVRWWLGSCTLWINGRKHGVQFDGPASSIEPESAVEILPQVQYVVKVEVREDREFRVEQHLAGEADINFEIDVAEA